MNFSVKRASLAATWSHAFSRPRVLACTSLSEVVPLDLMLLRVQVTGWGWLDIRGPQGFRRREFFREPGTLEVTVPVRTVVTLRVMNPWGSRSYPIDTQTAREEAWRPPEDAFRVRLPSDLQPAYDRFGTLREAQLPSPTPIDLVTRVPSFKLRASPAELTTPDLVVRALPRLKAPVTAPSAAPLPAWNPQLPMATLESRMNQAHIDH